MSAYSLIIKLYHKVSWMGLSSGQDMNRVTFSVVAIMLLAATTLPFVLNAGFGKAPQGAQLSLVEQSPNYRDGQFHNQLPTPGFTGQKNMLAAWWDFWSRNEKTRARNNVAAGEYRSCRFAVW